MAKSRWQIQELAGALRMHKADLRLAAKKGEFGDDADENTDTFTASHLLEYLGMEDANTLIIYPTAWVLANMSKRGISVEQWRRVLAARTLVDEVNDGFCWNPGQFHHNAQVNGETKPCLAGGLDASEWMVQLSDLLERAEEEPAADLNSDWLYDQMPQAFRRVITAAKVSVGPGPKGEYVSEQDE